jgi:hypothetical protein
MPEVIKMETLEAYVKSKLLDTINFDDFMKKPEYAVSRGVMRMEYEQAKNDKPAEKKD